MSDIIAKNLLLAFSVGHSIIFKFFVTFYNWAKNLAQVVFFVAGIQKELLRNGFCMPQKSPLQLLFNVIDLLYLGKVAATITILNIHTIVLGCC